MSNPLEAGEYRLYVWEVGGSSAEPTDTGRTGTLAEMTQAGQDLCLSGESFELPDGRTLDPHRLAGYVAAPEAVKPE